MSDEPRRIFRLPSARDFVEREVDDEIRFHIETRSQELERDGMTPAAAQEQASREFGDAAAARTELAAIDRHRLSRTERVDWWSGLRQDVRFAVRSLRRARGFAAAALLTLALGIGAATAMLSVVDSILLSPLPYPNHDRIVLVWTTARLPEIRSDELPFSAGNFLALRDRARSFDDLAGFRSSRLTITDGAEPEQLPGARVSAGLFEVLGVRPLLGRTFDATDDGPGAAHAAILGYGLWQRRFGGDPGVVGRSVHLNGASYTVVGIMPRGFDFTRGAELPGGLQFPSRTEIWTPLAFTPRDLQQRGTLNIAVAGSLRPGVSAAQARDEVDRIMHAMAPEFGGKPEEWGGNVVRMQAAATQEVRGGLLLLLGAVELVLLVACTNVSNLLLVRTASRQRELAVRAALGAGRGRLVRQLVSENVLRSAARAAAPGAGRVRGSSVAHAARGWGAAPGKLHPVAARDAGIRSRGRHRCHRVAPGQPRCGLRRAAASVGRCRRDTGRSSASDPRRARCWTGLIAAAHRCDGSDYRECRRPPRGRSI